VILVVAFFVVEWPIGIVPKWLVVLGASLAITLALVELGLRGRVTRVLLGARAQPASPVVATPDDGMGEPAAARPSLEVRHGRAR
jgi:hypothetical protein